MRHIPQHTYEEWNAKYHVASTSLENRENKMEELQDIIESSLDLIGATAIEDMLQD